MRAVLAAALVAACYDQGSPVLDLDGATLYYGVYAGNVPSRSSADSDLAGGFISGGSVLYLARDPADAMRDIHEATWDGATWTVATVPDLSHPSAPTGTEGDPWISPDERTIYFQRNNRLYKATR